MKPISAIIAVVSFCAGNIGGFCQGFVNLNFEAANVSGYSPGSQIPAANAFPGWTASAIFVLYDTLSLSGNSISLMDTNGGGAYYPPIQGKYFALFESDDSPQPGGGPVSLGQTGQIPPSAESITFWGNDESLQVTFNGNPLSFIVLGATANYTIYGADISAFAGQTGQLLFTDPPFSSSDELDNIEFSSAPIPEPGALALMGAGGILFGWRRWRKFTR